MPGLRVRAWWGIQGCLAMSPEQANRFELASSRTVDFRRAFTLLQQRPHLLVEVQEGRDEGGLVHGWGSLAFPGSTCRGNRLTEILRFRALDLEASAKRRRACV